MPPFPASCRSISWTVENQGTGEAQPGWYDHVYFSTDSVWDNQDTRIGQFHKNLTVASGARYSQMQGVTLPQVAAGDYYLILRANGNGDLHESDTENNDRAVPITLTTPDLTPTNVTATPGNAQVTINWKFDRKAARKKFGYNIHSFKRSET